MTEKSINLRIAELVAKLADMKRNFFVKGIEAPMSDRAEIEPTIANLRLQKLQINELEKARAMQVRQRRGKLVKEKLIELGYPTLQAECNAQAEQEIPPINIEGITHA